MKGVKDIQIENGGVKLSLFADGMILYIGSPKDSTKELLETINKYNKVAGYKINAEKYIVFLCTNKNSFCICHQKNKIT